MNHTTLIDEYLAGPQKLYDAIDGMTAAGQDQSGEQGDAEEKIGQQDLRSPYTKER